MEKENRLLERTRQDRPFLLDGAMGTMLYQRGHYEGRLSGVVEYQ